MSKYLKELPNDNESRKNIMAQVDTIVDAMLQIDSAKDVIKDSKTYVQDKYGVDGGYVNSIAQIKYDIEYNERKRADKIEADKELLDLVENL
jgi:dTDP-D-glucose 4,6-dehydratase